MSFFAGSLHLYERDMEAARKCEDAVAVPGAVIPFITWPGDASGSSAEERVSLAQVTARMITLGEVKITEPGIAGEFAKWFAERVPPLPEGHVQCVRCSYISDAEARRLCPVCGNTIREEETE
jgi:hypothetical protein